MLEPEATGGGDHLLGSIALLVVERSSWGIVFEDVEVEAIVAPGEGGAFTAIEETAGDAETTGRGDYGQIGDVGVVLAVALSVRSQLPE